MKDLQTINRTFLKAMMHKKKAWLFLLVLPIILTTTPVFAESISVTSSAVNYPFHSRQTRPEYVKVFLHHLQLANPQEKIYGVELEKNSIVSGQKLLPTTLQPLWGYPHDYLSDVVNHGPVAGLQPIAVNYGYGPMELTLSVNQGVQATYSDNAGVNAGIISAGIGENVTSSYTVTGSSQVLVPSGEEYKLSAYPVYTYYTYQVWYNPVIGGAYQIGSGYASIPREYGTIFVWSND